MTQSSLVSLKKKNSRNTAPMDSFEIQAVFKIMVFPYDGYYIPQIFM